MQPLKFGLVGAGGNKVGDGRGLSHARHLAALDAGQIVAVCDIAGDAAQRVAAQLLTPIMNVFYGTGWM